jgi:hypothetical protein
VWKKNMQPTTPEWLQDVRRAEQLFDQKLLDEAAEMASRALKRNPNAALAHQVLALVQVERLQIREAIPRLEQALALRPDLVPSHNGLAQCYMHLDNLDWELQALNTALCLDPHHAFAHFNRALLWLKRGEYREGWVEYEWRFAAGLVQRPDLPRPRWDGSSLEGRSILVHTEQGLGDVLQFVRLLPVIRRQARRLVFACQPPMRAFLRSLSCIDEFFPVDDPGEIHFDVCCALLSLPSSSGWMGATIIPRLRTSIPTRCACKPGANGCGRFPASRSVSAGKEIPHFMATRSARSRSATSRLWPRYRA